MTPSASNFRDFPASHVQNTSGNSASSQSRPSGQGTGEHRQVAVPRATPRGILPSSLTLFIDSNSEESRTNIMQVGNLLRQNFQVGSMVKDFTLYTRTIEDVINPNPNLLYIISRLTNLESFSWMAHYPLGSQGNVPFQCHWLQLPSELRSVLYQRLISPTLRKLYILGVVGMGDWLLSFIPELNHLEIAFPFNNVFGEDLPISLERLGHLKKLVIHLDPSQSGLVPVHLRRAWVLSILGTAPTDTNRPIDITIKMAVRVREGRVEPYDLLNIRYLWSSFRQCLEDHRIPKRVTLDIKTHHSMISELQSEWRILKRGREVDYKPLRCVLTIDGCPLVILY